MGLAWCIEQDWPPWREPVRLTGQDCIVLYRGDRSEHFLAQQPSGKTNPEEKGKNQIPERNRIYRKRQNEKKMGDNSMTVRKL